MATRRTCDICQRDISSGCSAKLEYDPGDLQTIGEDRLEYDLCINCKKLIYPKLLQLIDEMRAVRKDEVGRD